jgi:hypothetical protein
MVGFAVKLICCLQFSLFTPQPKGCVLLLAWLDAAGNSPHCRAVERGKRVVDLGPGDRIWHRGKTYIIEAVEPYRWHEVDEAYLSENADQNRGFVVR